MLKVIGSTDQQIVGLRVSMPNSLNGAIQMERKR